MRWIVLIALLGLSPTLLAKISLLRVEVLRAEYTGHSSACPEPEPQCLPFHFWFVYDVRVKQVIQGDLQGGEVRFAVHHHGPYAHQVFNDGFVFLETLTNQANARKLGVEYFATRIHFPDSYVCLPAEDVASLTRRLKQKRTDFANRSDACFDLSVFEDQAPFDACDRSIVENDVPVEVQIGTCKALELQRLNVQLLEAEQSLYKDNLSTFERMPQKGLRLQAFSAFEEGKKVFRLYRAQTCGFEGTLSGAVEDSSENWEGSEASRALLRMECEFRMTSERIRMLYRQIDME